MNNTRLGALLPYTPRQGEEAKSSKADRQNRRLNGRSIALIGSTLDDSKQKTESIQKERLSRANQLISPPSSPRRRFMNHQDSLKLVSRPSISPRTAKEVFNLETTLKGEKEADSLKIQGGQNSSGPSSYRLSLSTNSYEVAPSLSLEDSLSLSTQAELPSPLAPPQNRDILQLLAYIENHPEERLAVLFVHPWLTSTETLVETICQTYQQTTSSQQKCLLLQIAADLLDHSFDYPLSSEAEDQLHGLALIELEGTQETDPKVLEACETLLTKTRSDLPLVQAPFFHFSRITKPFGKLESKVESNKYKKRHLKRLACDFKKYTGQTFSQIRLSELVDGKWNKKPNETPGFTFYKQTMESIIYLAVSHIVSAKNATKRARWCSFYIQLAKESLKIGDLTTALAIDAALNQVSVSRLKTTWNKVPAPIKNEKKELDTLFDTKLNYGELRKYIRAWLANHKDKTAESCLVPFVGLFQRDITFLNDGNPTHLQDGQLNEEKIELFESNYRLFYENQQEMRKQANDLWRKPYYYNFCAALESLPDDPEEIFYQLSVKNEKVRS
ncbi:RasGEF domain-containing protein [Candidatus Protochlamydia phocaeensis]|uniref:RasGEF domain-containing protein n=1 Tax=Candidatus Protochlamydia phocaeensis TaxID=1414722 RepID=UPI000837DE8F|nr:RasGEF domain-containing protein [Candidatus Protochlamydia phocaeensis]